jgi:hypothetical protein
LKNKKVFDGGGTSCHAGEPDVWGLLVNAQNDSIEFGDTPCVRCPTYSVPRLQRLGSVSELTEANATQAYDGNGYAS